MRRFIGLLVIAVGLSLLGCEPPDIEPRRFQVSAFPNPFFETVVISAFALPIDETISIRFVNEDNEAFLEEDNVRSGDSFLLGLEEEPSGLFFLEISNGTETEVIQVIKGERE